MTAVEAYAVFAVVAAVVMLWVGRQARIVTEKLRRKRRRMLGCQLPRCGCRRKRNRRPTDV